MPRVPAAVAQAVHKFREKAQIRFARDLASAAIRYQTLLLAQANRNKESCRCTASFCCERCLGLNHIKADLNEIAGRYT